MSTIRIEKVTKRFGSVIAVDDVSLEIPEGSFTGLLGPSGCGKTTLLRLIVGLDRPTSGSIFLDGQDVTYLPPERRDVGIMFQSYALFPHMTVAGNLAFPLKMKGIRDRPEVEERVQQALKLVRLEGLDKRSIRQLSGGQRQRVALGRAFIASPRVLLLDEPLSNLDARLREDMQVELIDLHKQLRLTTVFVTHDQEEALSLADHVVLMREGRIEQRDAPETLYARPATPFVADFIGAANLIVANIVEEEGGGWIAVTRDNDRFKVPPPPDGRPGERQVMIRQENIVLKSSPEDSEVALPGIVQARVYRGATVRFVASVGSQTLTAIVGKEVTAEPGSKIHLCWSIADSVVL